MKIISEDKREKNIYKVVFIFCVIIFLSNQFIFLCFVLIPKGNSVLAVRSLQIFCI